MIEDLNLYELYMIRSFVKDELAAIINRSAEDDAIKGKCAQEYERSLSLLLKIQSRIDSLVNKINE